MVVTVLNWQVVDGELDTIEGTATVNSTDGSAKLIVNLPIRGTDGKFQFNIKILNTIQRRLSKIKGTGVWKTGLDG